MSNLNDEIENLKNSLWDVDSLECQIDIYEGLCDVLENSIKDICKDLQILHRNCDPCDMTYEDHLIWEKWNKVFT